MKYGLSSTQLWADFVFPGTGDEFVGDDFYWSQFSLGRLLRLPNKIESRSRLLVSVCWCGFHRVSMGAIPRRTMIGENLSGQIAFCACLRLTLPANNISTSH